MYQDSGEYIDPMAYGMLARQRLAPFEKRLQSHAGAIADQLHNHLVSDETTARTLDHLNEAMRAALRSQITVYIRHLLSSELSRAAHRATAHKTGRAQMLAGVDLFSLIDLYHYLEGALEEVVDQNVSPATEREAIMQLLRRRLFFDKKDRVAFYQILDQTVAALYGQIDRHIRSTENLADLIQGSLAIVAQLPGRINAFFSRLDAHGQLEIEQSFGPDTSRYYAAFQQGKVPRPSIDSSSRLGRAPAGQAWRSGQLVAVDALQTASNIEPWRAMAEEVGVQSLVAIPLTDSEDQTIALLTVYSHSPGFFSINRVHAFFAYLQTALSHALVRVSQVRVIPLQEQQVYRELLSAGAVRMLYHPIIRLTDGQLVKMEALARLCDENGQHIPPNRFLPAFGNDDLLRLFELGLEQACADYHRLASRGISTSIAINCPAEGCGDPRYEHALSRILGAYDVPRRALDFEVLETGEAIWTRTERMEFLHRLDDSGVRIVQDDLGSGHSSLQRLDQYPFHEVKIDQGLVRGALREPHKIIEFIFNLTRLAHAFHVDVTVEGVEHEGLIEASAILGADHGQGFGIAYPMPVDELALWHEQYVYAVRADRPRTALGAMAAYLLWDLQLSTVARSPDQRSAFQGARGLIQQFIEARQLESSAMASHVRRIHSLALSGETGRNAKPFLAARRALVSDLTARCYAENPG